MLNKKIIFALGSNLGDRKLFLEKAIDKMSTYLELSDLKKSNIFENQALLLENSPKEWDIDFYNIAVSANINFKKFPALTILQIIKKIESELGRKNDQRWSPREIDIDILAIEDLRIDLEKKLQIPHKELLNRDFFLKPTEEIEPELLDKIKNVIL